MLSGLRNFFLAFLISLIVCGLGAWVLINYINEEFGESEIEPITDIHGEIIDINEDASEMDYYRFTALFIGIDNGDSQRHARLEFDEDGRLVLPEEDEEDEEDNRKINNENEDEEDEDIHANHTHNEPGARAEADTIILIDINMRTGEFMMTYLPRDMRVEVKGYAMRLGAVYADYGTEMLVQVAKAYTGIGADYYCVLDYGGIVSLFDFLGRIDYNVPVNMYYLPRPYDFYELHEEDVEKLKPEIELRSGFQRLDGEQIVQLLRFRGYRGNYLDEEVGRENTHKSFIQEVITQQVTFENFSRAHEIYEAVAECIADTNLTEQDFMNYAHLIFGFADFEFKPIDYPGNRSYLDGVYFFVPNHQGAIRTTYREYKK